MNAPSASGPSCPQCGKPMGLLVEPGILEFYCVDDHPFEAERLLSDQAEAARRALRDALEFWEARAAELGRLAGEARADGQEQAVTTYEHRALVVRERIQVLRRTLARRA